MNKVQAKTSFYHDLTGSRAKDEVFEVDSQTLSVLEQAGYVQKAEQSHANAEMAQAMAEIESKQQEYGQAQAQANENASLMAHVQNVQANEHTQQTNQEIRQRAEQNGANHTNEADQQAMRAQEKQFQPTANPAATAKTTARKADK
jgi:hypothetical protein